MKADRNNWPFMVRLGLRGLPTRGSAWVFVWLSLAFAVGSVVAGLFYPLAFVGVLMVFAALWYYQAIRWVDQNGSWN